MIARGCRSMVRHRVPGLNITRIEGRTMNGDKGSYVIQLKAIVACSQSNGYLKKWASDKLVEIEVQARSSSKRVRLPISTK